MNKLFLKLSIIFILLNPGITKGQVVVNGMESQSCLDQPLKDDDYKKLKNSTVYFICPENKNESRDSIEKVIKSAWDYCEIKVVSKEEAVEHVREKNAAFISFGYVYKESGGLRYIYLELWKFRTLSGDNSSNKITYAKIPISLSCEMQKIYINAGKKSGFGEATSGKALLDYLENKAEIDNLKSGIVANYLKLIQENLDKKSSLNCHSVAINREELPKLKDETIYITSSILIRGWCAQGEPWDIKKLMAKYPYKYELISFEQLNEKIISGEQFYYAIAMRDDTQGSSIMVFNNANAECIYTRDFIGQAFKPEVFERLAKEIKKS